MLGCDDPAAVDQHAAAVVASVGLQADVPGPEEGAGLCHVHHRHLTVPRCGHSSEAWRLTGGALLLATRVLCHPGDPAVQRGTEEQSGSPLTCVLDSPTTSRRSAKQAIQLHVPSFMTSSEDKTF